jgi:hypothetical protein
MRFDRRVEEEPRPKRVDWKKKARSLAHGVRQLGDSAVGLRIACSGRCVTQQRTGQERERVNVEQEGGGGQQ